jgi:3-oxoacyl-[acyl-carrier protein] reductase
MNETVGGYADLAGKVAVITGGSRGIGARTAKEFARQGVRVAVIGRDRDALDAVVAEIADAGGVALGLVTDVTDGAALGQARDQVEAAYGPVDILAAFAGGQGAPTPSVELTEERFRQVIDSELTSAFLTVRTFLPGMVERGSGSILLMSSAAGRQPSQANLAYGVANAGVVMLARHLAAEVGPAGVRVNCLAPSSIRTEKVESHMPAAVQEQVAAAHPLRRLGTTGDVAAAALFLASDAASFLTGLTIDVAGGRITN